MNEADLLLAFGVRFDDRVTGKVAEFAKHGKIVHIDIDPSEINKNKAAHIPIVSDVKFALAELNKIVEAPEDLAAWHEQVADWKKADPFKYDKNFDGILQQHAIDELWKLTHGEDTIITVGVGQHQMWAAQFYKFMQPRTFLVQLRPGHDGLRPAGGDGRESGASRTSWSSTSTATAAS